MTDPVRERCELLVENRSNIHKSFLLEKELMSVASALIFTSKGEKADIDKLKEARKILNRSAGPTVIGAFTKTSDDSKK